MTDVLAIPGMADLRRRTQGDRRVCVAILDGPAALDHPCFEGAEIAALDGPWSQAPAALETTQHATHIASIILGQPGTAVEGIAPRCRGLNVSIGRDVEYALTSVELAQGIAAAFAEGADVIHIAACIPTGSGKPDDMLTRAVRTCLDNNVLVVAPGGNMRGESLCFPAAVPGALAVGAADEDGQTTRFSNWGGVYREQGIVAPGTQILGAWPDGGTSRQKGTSVAAPVVSGVAALLMSEQLRQGWPLDAGQVRQALLASATPSDADEPQERERALAGFLNIEGAVRELYALNEGRARAVRPSMTPAPVPVFCLGQVGYDFGTPGRRDRFRTRLANPDDPRQMAAYLADRPSEAAALTWTLSLDGGPLYALAPGGPFAAQIHAALATGLAADRVAIPGVLAGGAARLLSGQSLPILGLHDPTGMTALDGVDPALDRLYHACRNPGVDPADRALNAVAADGAALAGVLTQAGARVLEEVSAAPDPRGCPGAWAVELRFVDPANTRRPATVYRFALDLAENPPVLHGRTPGYLADGV